MSLSCHVRARRGDFRLDFGFEAPVSSVAVVGPSGAGKSSLLLGLAGLIKTESVSLTIDGETIVAPGDRTPPHRRGVGYLFQDGRLFPHMTVADNVSFGHRYGQSSLEVEEALALVDLEGFEKRWPASLSGGEARRVALARVLATAPRVLLLDEPFSGLDPARRAGLLPYLLRLREVVRVPLILISHDPRDGSDLCEFVAHIRDGANDGEAGRLRE